MQKKNINSEEKFEILTTEEMENVQGGGDYIIEKLRKKVLELFSVL